MGQALNTMVNGSTGTCFDAAAWLSKLCGDAHTADGAARQARAAAEHGWHGPARDAFDEALHGVPGDLKGLTDRAYQCEWALREFAEQLKKVIDLMQDALERARNGDLRVDGPFIVSPERPAGIANLPTDACTPADARVAAQNYGGDIRALRAAQLEYNAKIVIYNECKEIVNQARNLEGRAHHELQNSLRSVGEAAKDWGAIGITSATWATTNATRYVGTLEGSRQATANQAARWEAQSKFLTDWAEGKVTSIPDGARPALDMAAKKSSAAADYRLHVDQFEKYTKFVPPGTRAAIAAYPGQGAIGDVGQHAKLPIPKSVAPVIKGLPYVGGTLTAFNEIRGAVKGEQSWGKAAADTTGSIGGGALGTAGSVFLADAAAAGVWGAPLGPVGVLVVGTIGGTVGAVGGQYISDLLVPE